ncbi:TetR/AcrR family transcriptional regulator [Lactiplantibacillus fabifermentans]|uniref:HTH tetR-type domain-containing protein n=2 Tax=Lactiplantibacillus fabifermentans TaxID=483011 RepID=A0A0R2NQ54_9LACO|nr:TetR/AcrR family transcriptional regulator [Lactiplantibacillus fabifermentans]ETY74423.1 hypothetical protein LFAB_07310 [Lactiplantibacillus fabifermentans T30PCM01]KRO26994.1 hypothetical protein DY78_GL000430 [Lactiplantibacillus fabifermentans DSM 21115]
MTKSAQQSEKILKVARQLFATKGYEATTTRQINQAAGTAEGLLYYYFPHGKRQILDTIVHIGVQERLDVFAARPMSDVTASNLASRLLELFDLLWTTFSSEENYQAFIITVRERALLSDEQSAWLMERIDEVQAQLADSLRMLPEFLTISDAQLNDWVGIIFSIFQKTIYDELLIRNHRQLPELVRDEVINRIELLIQLSTD